MTKSIEIVNTSNWEHEDVFVKNGENGKVLKPGESIQVHPGNLSPDFQIIFMEPPEGKREEPFIMNGRQVFPEVFVGFK